MLRAAGADFGHRIGNDDRILIGDCLSLNCLDIGLLPASHRSRILNRPILGALDGRKADGRALRDLTAALLADFGHEPSMRAVLLARAVARALIEIGHLETIEASGTAESIDRASDIADALKRLGVAYRKLDAALQREPRASKPSNSLDAYLRSKAEQTA